MLARTVRWRARPLWSFVLLMGLLVGGVALPGAPSVAQEPASIRFAFWGDLTEQAAYERVVTAFERTRPDVDIVVDYTPGQADYYRKITTDFAGGDPPDVFLINYRQFGQYAARGALEPVAPYLASSEAIAAVNYAPIAMDAFMFRGAQVCMPQNVSSLVVYYNVDLFTANDVPLPEAGWTWNDFISAARALTQDTDGDGQTDLYGVVVEPVMYRMASFVWSAGGEVVDDVDSPTALTLDTPEARDGLEKFISLGVNGHNVVPPEAEVAAEDDGTRFMRGEAAMFLQSRREVPTLREIETFTWDVAPLPVIAEEATVLHSDAFCMAEDGDAKDAVWSFVEYAAGDEGQRILAETGRIVPALDSVAQSAVFLNGVPIASDAATETPEALPPANSQVFLDNIAVMHRLPSLSTWPEVEDVFNAEFDRSFYAPLDVPAAVATVTAKSRAAFDRAAVEDFE